MVSSPVQNLSDFLKNRPPLVVFLICLVSLAVCTFYFAFEIKKDDPVINIDKKHDWIQMLKHFNKLDVCINTSTWTNEIFTRETEEEFKNEISVQTQITVETANMLKSLSTIYGFLSLEGWYSTSCQDSKKLPQRVAIFFNVPPQNISSSDSMDICVTIKGPAQFLPSLKQPLCKPVDKHKSAKEDKGYYLSSKLVGTYDTNFCKNGSISKFIFDLTIPEIRNYLSDDVRTEIYIHLMWCSYFLVFVIFLILSFSIIRKSDYLEKKEQSARLL